MAPRLSVIMPFYGVESYIGAALESIRRQTFTDLEAILVDDGSLDGSRGIAERYAERDDRFRLVTQANQGVGPARNHGFDVATGDYVTFIDSDDLVAWHAYEVMVGTLDRTGSAFAACNARRFTDAGAIRASWAHVDAFAREVPATHISRLPDLVLDRMPWNKVYRRDFFTEGGYRYPPGSCQDFPVSLQAHLDATAVDVVSDPLYYWRERGSKDSETQQFARIMNLAQRVESAQEVLTIAEPAPANVRERLHWLLARIDLLALMQSFAVLPDPDVSARLALGHELARLLDPQVLSRRPPLDRVQLSALHAEDVDLLRALSLFRSSGGEARATITRRPGRPWVLDANYPGLGRQGMDPEAFRVDPEALELRTVVDQVEWGGQGLALIGTMAITGIDAGRGDRLSMSFTSAGSDVELPLPMQWSRETSQDGSARHRFMATVDLERLATLPTAAWPLEVTAQLASREWHRDGAVHALRPDVVARTRASWLSDRVLVRLVAGTDGRLRMVRITRPATVDVVTAEGAVLHLSGTFDDQGDSVEVRVHPRQPRPSIPVGTQVVDSGSGSRYQTAIELAGILAEALPDDPCTRRISLPLTITTGARTRPLHWPSALRPEEVYDIGGFQVRIDVAEDLRVRIIAEPTR